jgi:phosphonate transport system permease protein
MIPSGRSDVTRIGRWLALIILIWAFWGPITQIPFAIRNIPFAVDYVTKMIPPDLSILPRLWLPLLETVQMAIVGTVLATAVALPVSFLAARNTTSNRLISFMVRGVLNFLRSMPAMVWAMLFVSLSGLGTLAGVLGITAHVAGALGKVFFEYVETTGPKIQDMLEAMRIDGATERQVIRYGLFPEVLPLFANYILYRFESTIRTSTIMGLVGAGGLGLELTMSIRMFRRREALAIILIILGLVSVVDHVSSIIRRHILQQGGYE